MADTMNIGQPTEPSSFHQFITAVHHLMGKERTAAALQSCAPPRGRARMGLGDMQVTTARTWYVSGRDLH